MKYTTEELIFAAAVRDLAAAIRVGARPKAEDGQWRTEKFAELLKNWDAANPVSAFVPSALGRIKEVADIIKIEVN